MTQRLKDLAKRLAQQYGIRQLKPGQSRPLDYYIGNRATGQPLISSDNAIVLADTVNTDEHSCGASTTRLQ